MRVLHLTLVAFCHVLLAAFVLFSHLATASPLTKPAAAPAAIVSPQPQPSQPQPQPPQPNQIQPALAPAPAKAALSPKPTEQQSAELQGKLAPAVAPVIAKEPAAAAPVEKVPEASKPAPAPAASPPAPVEAKKSPAPPPAPLEAKKSPASEPAPVSKSAPAAPEPKSAPAAPEQERPSNAAAAAAEVTKKTAPVEAAVEAKSSPVEPQPVSAAAKGTKVAADSAAPTERKAPPAEPAAPKRPASPVASFVAESAKLEPYSAPKQPSSGASSDDRSAAPSWLANIQPIGGPGAAPFADAAAAAAAAVGPQSGQPSVEQVIVKRVELPVESPKPLIVPQVVASAAAIQSIIVKETNEQPTHELIVALPAVVPAVPEQVAPLPAEVAISKVRAALPPSPPPPAVVESVKGGLGPLHLLAASLCNYKPDKTATDETLSLLYSQRAALRKSLYELLSLKFTNLEKFSSRLGPGPALEVAAAPAAAAAAPVGAAAAAGPRRPSHGWPVVGQCTAHDLKLMAEAAWCDTSVPPVLSVGAALEAAVPAPKAGAQQQVAQSAAKREAGARSLDKLEAEPPSSSVVSKVLQVAEAPLKSGAETSPAASGANAGAGVAFDANQQQNLLASIQAAATGAQSTRECRRAALRLTKSLFNHLAEDQSQQSDSWPKLYAQMSQDECARKRMIDVVQALASFRGESVAPVRRDNLEFAFAMDDLRTKVLENELNTPLTFDKQFIEVEQFLQQSVKLMLSNIDPSRARLTSMRYRSLMSPATSSADDQCIELHQRLLAKNYPTDCNPNQLGQLPDVLRMAANSLALWSVENEIAKHSPVVSADQLEFPAVGISQQSTVNECIANLVKS